ncbi:hypothetical protein H4684_001793 [Desulfomicrobium macestii]|uniref:DUF3568 family protein n=2 Tax=Desulfomicrobium TaxID=898 RepID=A0A8G2F6Z4_DESNO|nr:MULTISPECIES: DUF3568 family protein [Desulfomicrobium]MBE1425149.1 hypothetical protein [Desulfomicrobium macestii]SFL55392.1 Protein of unknown function [Desulfomicrobium norvegicum]
MKALKNLLIILVLLSTGCAALVVGGAAAVGTYTYVAGMLQRTYNANLDTTYQATLAGCEALGLPVQDRQKQLSKASVKVVDGDRDVWISLTAQSSTTTEVSVRVGYLGDELASRRIHEAIQARL